MATQETVNAEELEQMMNRFSDIFAKEIDRQMERMHTKQYSTMENGDIAIRIGDTVYETDVPTVLLSCAIGGATAYIGYKVITSLF